MIFRSGLLLRSHDDGEKESFTSNHSSLLYRVTKALNQSFQAENLSFVVTFCCAASGNLSATRDYDDAVEWKRFSLPFTGWASEKSCIILLLRCADHKQRILCYFRRSAVKKGHQQHTKKDFLFFHPICGSKDGYVRDKTYDKALLRDHRFSASLCFVARAILIVGCTYMMRGYDAVSRRCCTTANNALKPELTCPEKFEIVDNESSLLPFYAFSLERLTHMRRAGQSITLS